VSSQTQNVGTAGIYTDQFPGINPNLKVF
jgi:hypothetical protein